MISKRLKENKEIVFLLLIFSILQLFLLLAHPRTLGWDESVYIGMGKYIYSAGTVGLWEDIRPVGLPLLLGLLWKLNLRFMVASQLLTTAFALGVLLLVYYIGKQIANKTTGFLAALLLAVTPIFFLNATYVLPHIPAAFFALLAAWFVLKEKPFLAGLFAGIAFMFRFPQGIVFAALLVFLFFQSLFSQRKETSGITGIIKAVMLSFGFMLALAPYFVANYFLYHDTAANTIHAIADPFLFAAQEQANPHYAVQGTLKNMFFYPVELVKQNFLLILFFAIALFFYVKNKEYKNDENLIMEKHGGENACIILLFFFIFAYYAFITNKQLRFALEFLPYISILASIGLEQFLSMQFMQKRKSMFTAILCIAIITIASFAIADAQKERAQVKELEEAYSFPQQLNSIDGAFITTFPLPAAYTDKLFIPAYADVPATIKGYEKEKAAAAYFMWYSGFYPCLDDACQQLKDEFYEKVKRENRMVYRKVIFNEEYAVFQIVR